MCRSRKIILNVLLLLAILCGGLFVIYLWNLDQKVLEWFYKQRNAICKKTAV